MSVFWMEALLAAALIIVVAASIPALLSLREGKQAPASDAPLLSPEVESALSKLQQAVSAEEQVIRSLSPSLPDPGLRERLATHVANAQVLVQQLRRAVGSILP